MKNNKKTCKKCKRPLEDNSKHLFCESCREDMISNVKKVGKVTKALALTGLAIVVKNNFLSNDD